MKAIFFSSNNNECINWSLLLYLIFVRIVEKDTLRHEISHHCVTPKSRDVGTYNGQNLRNEALHKPTQTAILHDKTLNMPLFRDAGIKHL